jgi:uncharacterized zinc-type alcohol dehydrogenase-like protein
MLTADSAASTTTPAQLSTAAYAATSATTPLAPFTITRREPGTQDVLIEILFCGVCHSDIHQARGEWGQSKFPMVPGHEIIGKVSQVGSAVKKWKAGDTVGVGCFVDSCRQCEPCKAGEENYCDEAPTFTYNGFERDGKTLTQGGYSKQITVNEDYVLRIPDGLSLAGAAPLLCAGITLYSPLKHFGAKAGDAVAIVGLGGLGHMGVKLAKARGMKVTVLSHSPSKKDDALRLGADEFIATKEEGVFKKNAGRFDLIIDTVSAPHDFNDYLGLLKRDSTMVLVGIPDPSPVQAFPLVGRRRSLAGSCIGGIRETQEMLDFCAKHNVVSDVEVIAIQKINEAYERTIQSDVRYRFVIDLASL